MQREVEFTHGTRLAPRPKEPNPAPFLRALPVWGPRGNARESIQIIYCLSYIAVLVSFLPAESLADTVRARVLPSGDTTIFPLVVTFPSFLFSSVRVCSLTVWYDRESAVGSPVRG